MKDNLVETIIGALVVAIAAAFVLYGYSVTDSGSGGDAYEVTAQFDRVDGLTIGSDVRMSGIKVGTITGLSLNTQNYYADVTMAIGNEIELPDDSSAKITCHRAAARICWPKAMKILYTQGSVDLIALVSQALFSAGDGEGDKD